MAVPSALPQIPFDRYIYDTAVLVNPADLHGGIWDFIGDYDYALADLYNQTNGIFGTGCQISANASGPSPMRFAVSAGRGRCLSALKTVQLVTPGIIGQPPVDFNFTIPDGSSIPGGQSRIDIVGLQYSWTLYTDADGFNHQVDTTTIVTVQGTPGVSPVAPVFPNNQYTEIGQLTIHSGDTTASQATIDNTKRNTFKDVLTLAQGFPSGFIGITGASTAPPTWALCDGGSDDPTLQPALFAAIGYNFGHGAGNFFKRPLIVDGMVIGAGNTYSVGGSYGASTVTLDIAHIPSHAHTDSGHTHVLTDPQHNHTQNSHGHGFTDPQHSHGITDAGHNHTQVAHTHTVTDPTHNHAQNSHSHSFSDPGHTHLSSLTDNGHTHGVQTTGANSNLTGYARIDGGPPGTGAGSLLISTGSSNQTPMSLTNASAGTGASVGSVTGTNGASSTSITNGNTTATNNGNTTGVSVNSALTGASVNNTTATNVAASTGLSVNNGAAAIGATGGGTPFSIIPPVVGATYIIKY